MKIFEVKFYINKFYCGKDVDLSFISPIVTRKLSNLDKTALSAMFKCYEENSSPALVFGSQHGQFERLSKLTEQFKTENEVSPIGFSASVHNNTIGVFSLLNKINAPYTAISAGENTLVNTLCEGIFQLKENKEVLLCCADSFEGENFAVAALISKKPSENSLKIKVTNSHKTLKNTDYKAFSEFLTGSEKYFYSGFFRLEKI